jgi:hypothetical protein
MKVQLNSEVHARALIAAESLKQQLEMRLIGKFMHDGWRCACAACSFGPSKVVGIHMPTTYKEQIAMWLHWGCDMEDKSGKRWSTGLSDYISWAELYPMFRNHFAGIEVPVEHPHAESYYDRSTVDEFFGDQAAKEGRIFTPSGRTVVVGDDACVYVRPIGDPTNSVWVNAEIRVDANMERFTIKDALFACNVNPFALGQDHGRGHGCYYAPGGLSRLPTYYVRIPDEGQVKNLFFPIARLVAFNKTTSEATFELDQKVESFTAASK